MIIEGLGLDRTEGGGRSHVLDDELRGMQGGCELVPIDAQRAENGVTPYGEVGRREVEAACACDGALLADQPLSRPAVQRVRAQQEGVDDHTGHVHGVASCSGFVRGGEFEGRLPQARDQGPRQRRRIVRRLIMQGRQLTSPVRQNNTQGDLTDVGEVRHTELVPRLPMKGEASGLRISPSSLHPVGVPVDPINPDVVHVQPATPVHPWTPPARLGDLDRLTGDFCGQQTKGFDVQGRAVVEAEVVVRAGQVITSSTTTPEEHRLNALDLYQLCRHPRQVERLSVHLTIVAGPGRTTGDRRTDEIVGVRWSELWY